MDGSPVTSGFSTISRDSKLKINDKGHLLMNNQPIRRDLTDFFIISTQKALRDDTSRSTQISRIIRNEGLRTYTCINYF